MLDTIFVLVIGMFIGWNIPQPGYAKWIQNWIVTKIKGIGNNEKDNADR